MVIIIFSSFCKLNFIAKTPETRTQGIPLSYATDNQPTRDTTTWTRSTLSMSQCSFFRNKGTALTNSMAVMQKKGNFISHVRALKNVFLMLFITVTYFRLCNSPSCIGQCLDSSSFLACFLVKYVCSLLHPSCWICHQFFFSAL